MVTPEGATIQIYSGVTGWTAQSIYNLLKPNAYQLSLIGPSLTIKVQTTYASSTTTGSSCGATSCSFNANMWLDAAPGANFSVIPDEVVAHEYGHVWTLYHLYMNHGGDWTLYLQARGLYGNPSLNTNYMWNTAEIAAEDYRLLFGTTTAQNDMAQMNYQIPDARTVAGLKDFFLNTWGP